MKGLPPFIASRELLLRFFDILRRSYKERLIYSVQCVNGAASCQLYREYLLRGGAAASVMILAGKKTIYYRMNFIKSIRAIDIGTKEKGRRL